MRRRVAWGLHSCPASLDNRSSRNTRSSKVAAAAGLLQRTERICRALARLSELPHALRVIQLKCSRQIHWVQATRTHSCNLLIASLELLDRRQWKLLPPPVSLRMRGSGAAPRALRGIMHNGANCCALAPAWPFSLW